MLTKQRALHLSRHTLAEQNNPPPCCGMRKLYANTIEKNERLIGEFVRRPVKIVLRQFRSAVAALPWQLLMPMSPRQKCLSIDVFDLTSDTTRAAEYFAMVTSALELIARYQPMRLERMRRDLRRILVVRQAAAAYWPHMRACVMTPAELSAGDAGDVALTLVHEATHARIHVRGIEYEPARRERIERLCVRQQVEFAELLPNGERHIAHLTDALQAPWWTDQHLRQNKLNLLEQNAPQWLVGWLLTLFPPR